MSKKPGEPDEVQIPADKFDKMIRKALRVPTPSDKGGRKAPLAIKEGEKGRKHVSGYGVWRFR